MPSERLPIVPDPELDIAEFCIIGRGGNEILIRSYTPCGRFDLPLVIHLHGGGFALGGLETDDRTLRVLSRRLHCVVLNVEYRLAPAHRFPAGLEDCHDAVRWAASEIGHQKLRTDLTKGFILGGTSAGANFAAVIAHLAVQDGLTPSLTGLVLTVVGVCHPDRRPPKYRDRLLSIDEISDAPGFTRKSIDYFARLYGAPPEDPRLSPLLYPFHEGLAPRVYFQICGWDPRRDDGLLYAKILEENKTEVKADIYPGLPHAFWGMAPEVPVSQRWERDFIEGITWLLSGDSKEGQIAI